MRVNFKQFMQEAGIDEPFYPGKRLVYPCKQVGQYKNHCVVFDWRNPDQIRIEVKAGLSGRSLEKKDLQYYPVSFQAPTYIDIEIVNDNINMDADIEDDEDEDEDEESTSGKGGGGGKKPKKKALKDMQAMAMEAFGDALDAVLPEMGEIVDMVVMGKEMAADAYEKVMDTLATQIDNAKISATELIANAGKFVTKFTPPSFMEPKGNENANYTYNREKNANIAFNSSFT